MQVSFNLRSAEELEHVPEVGVGSESSNSGVDIASSTVTGTRFAEESVHVGILEA